MNKFLILMLGISCFSLKAPAQTVDEILDQYFENIGRRENWQQLNSLKIKGQVYVPSLKISFPIQVIKKRPCLEKIFYEVPGRAVSEGFDGTVYWRHNAISDSTEKLDTQLSELKKTEAAFESPFLNYRDKGFTVGQEGKETVAGTECHKLKLVKKKASSGELIEYHFFSVEDHLLLMVRATATTGMNAGQVFETYYQDYRRVGEWGLLMPYAIQTKVKGILMQSMKVQSYELNPEVTDAEFALPDREPTEK